MKRKHQLTIENISAEDIAEMITDRLKIIIKEQQAQRNKYQWYSRKQTAQMLGVDIRTLHNWNKTGILQSFSLGSRVFYRSDMVESAMKPTNP